VNTSIQQVSTDSDPTAQDSYSQIDIDDLHDPESSAGIILEMQDSQRYFEARMSKEAEEAAKQVRSFLSASDVLNFFFIYRRLTQ